MISNVVICEVDALIYVVLSKAEQHVPYGKLVGTTECLMLKSRCRTNRGRYKRVQLQIYIAVFNATFESSVSVFKNTVP